MSAADLVHHLRGACGGNQYLPSARVTDAGAYASTLIREISAGRSHDNRPAHVTYRVLVVRDQPTPTGDREPAADLSARDLIAAALPSLSLAFDLLRTEGWADRAVPDAVTALSQAIVILTPAVTP
jgi:hypothetical protein